jgi:hypothetical protein
MLEDIRTYDLPILRSIVTNVMLTPANFDNLSDADFDNLMLSHFDHIKDRTFTEVRIKLGSIHGNNGQAVLTDVIITNLMDRLSYLEIILNDDVVAGNNYRREIETEIRKLSPPLLGNRLVKKTLTEIVQLINNGVQKFRNDPPLDYVRILAVYLVAIRQQPDAKDAAEANFRKIQTIDILSNMLRPVSHLFRNIHRKSSSFIIGI